MLSQQDMEDFMEVDAALAEPQKGNAKPRKVNGAAETGTDTGDTQHEVRDRT
ncbi:hypothetical protein SAE02_72620 [Skermanella aerolata]|uniref:Uncharacterized protein n=1 Tax=Skermanella aerolata TaxID=393310 RepID=A0A512E325_9PROT|nr:hypothetical protein [Skermanella aerolata]KJB90149.1 hypothetical protein N826_38750 [Skermanella aerolata KACC 11604]GEO43114.1 hypothetical protein SAE02_72620 [Skermanella aerolata]